MRIKILNDSDNSLTNIRNIKLIKDKDNDNLPIIQFDCEKKFEFIFAGNAAIFTDNSGKELFRCDKIYVSWRYYEGDRRNRRPFVQLQTSPLKHKIYGKVAMEYMEKLLKNACNYEKNLSKRNPEDSENLELNPDKRVQNLREKLGMKYSPEILRYLKMARAFNRYRRLCTRWLRFTKDLRKRVEKHKNLTQIIETNETNAAESMPPT